jgi:hypothetical protein
VLPDLVNRHNVRMVQVGRHLGLAAKACHFARGGQLTGQDHLQSDDAVEALLPRPIDDAHAAAGDLVEQLVVADATPVGCFGDDRSLPAGRRGRRRGDGVGQAGGVEGGEAGAVVVGTRILAVKPAIVDLQGEQLL